MLQIIFGIITAFCFFYASGYFIQVVFRKQQVLTLLPSPSERIAGYGFYSLTCFISLVIFKNFIPGIIVIYILSLFALVSWKAKKKQKFEFILDTHDFLYYIVKLLFISIVIIIYGGLLFFHSAVYQLIPVSDLPKNLSAIISVYNAHTFPTPNPYFPIFSFAYNILFYIPLAIICKATTSLNSFYPVFAFALIWVTWNTIAIIREILAMFNIGKQNHIIGLIFATFFVGFTALVTHADNVMGFTHALQMQANVWADDPLVDYLYVPQHIFSILCILAAWVTLNSENSYKNRLYLQSILLIASALSSFIIAPLTYLVFFIFSIFNFFELTKMTSSRNNNLFNFIIATFMFLIFTVPFLLLAKKWAGTTGAVWFTFPSFRYGNSSFALELGLILIYFIFGIYQFLIHRSKLHISYLFIVISGIFLLYIMHYPDSPLKISLFLRLSCIPIATIGFIWLLNFLKSKNTILLILFGIFPAAYAVSLSLINIGFFISTSYIRPSSSVRRLIATLRHEPKSIPIFLPQPNQVMAALSGHLVYMNEGVIRPDFYIPSAQREQVRKALSLWRNNTCIANSVKVNLTNKIYNITYC